MKKLPIKELRKIIKKDFRVIKKQYEKCFSLKHKNGTETWLFDNFYVLEREVKNILKSLSFVSEIPYDESGLPLLYTFLFRELIDGKIKDIDNITQKIYENNFSITETELLELMLRSALISRAAQAVLENSELLGNVIVSLCNINDIDFDEMFEKLNKSEHILNSDETYRNSTNATKSSYRRILAKKAKEMNMSESEYAKEIADGSLNSGKSVVFYLEDKKSYKKGNWSIALEIVVPLILSALVALAVRNLFLVVLFYIPFWEITKVFILYFFMKKNSSCPIPKIEISEKNNTSYDTMLVISTLLPKAQNIESVKKHLMNLYLSNKAKGISVCLLADLKGADESVLLDDEENINAVKKMIDELNQKENVFSLFVRPRKFSQTQDEYTGEERKRGAITELVRAIKGDKSGFFVIHGNTKSINKIKYIMALDADTKLSFDCVKRLLSAAIHPQNRPQINFEKGIVENGYAIYAPKVETGLKAAYKTGFTRVMAGVGGTGHYSTVCSERYQDLFGKSIFSGKGLIDIEAFYLLLDNRFTDETILSHDILEGEFLNTAFIGEAVVTDSFPENEISYFKRQERWIRGDWQNLVFLFKKVQFKDGKKANPLSFISRFKLFDNLRRSLLPVFSLALILVSVFLPQNVGIACALIGVFSITINELFATFTDTAFSGGRAFYSVFYGDAIPNALKKLLQAVLALIMLPKNAVASIGAITRALYRRFISHKNMLQWVTAADTESENKSFSLFKNTFSSVACFLFLLIFGGALHLFIGMFFLSNTIFLIVSAKKPREKSKDFTYLEKEKLIEDAKKMWTYYDKYCNEKSNFLPPDNVQTAPVFRIAERTSPTNIGMMLCSCLAARDLSFISTSKLCDFISNVLSSVEKLEKWNGNLLNWYNTADLKPLCPIYVSTVDSGNLLCCLVALKQGLSEYSDESSEISGLIGRINTLIKNTDLSVLYNKNRKLFHIGYDLDKKELTNSYYDLLMSESRMTSYFAVSQRQVPAEHWGALSRMQARYKNHSGSVSWTGTMFEYFMPNLFVPSYKNSNTYETLKFCMLCQKSRTRGMGIPWGISESAFYKFDANMNYQYKAHGVGKLALNRYVNSELVISPYSTFLTMSFDKKASFNNIKKLEELEAVGESGLFEAIDFTPSRTEGQQFSVIQSYMAHHIGMSIIGILNAVKDNLMQKRFMSDENSMAAQSLLEESVINDKPLKNIDLKNTPPRPSRADSDKIVFENMSPTSPNVGLLSNGEWTTVLSDLGTGHSIYHLVNATRQSMDLLRQPLGIFGAVKTRRETIPLNKALDYNSKYSFKFESQLDRMILTTESESLNCKTIVKVHGRFPCEIREYKIHNNTKKEISGRLYIYFEPSLTTLRDEVSHKAFSNIFLLAKKENTDNTVLIERRPKGSNKAKFVACGFIENTKFNSVLTREAALGRHEGVFSLLDSKIRSPQDEGKLDICSLVYVDFTIPAKEEKSFNFFIMGGTTRDEISSRVSKLRAEKDVKFISKSLFLGDDVCEDKAVRLLPSMFYDVPKNERQQTALRENTADVKSLWAMGISGDNPIILTRISTVADMEKVLPFIKIHRKLRFCGVLTDLVIIYRAAVENEKVFEEKLSGIIQKDSSIELMRSFGGIHLINSFKLPLVSITALTAASSYEKQIGKDEVLPVPPKYEPKKEMVLVPKNAQNTMRDGAYEINKKPSVPWVYSLCNASFGTLLGDSTLGFTFAINSHDNKLTKWNNDVIYDNNGECLMLRIGDEIYDVIRSSSVLFGNNRAVYTAKIQDVTVVTTVTVPTKGMKKTVKTEILNSSENDITIELSYYIEPILGTDFKDAKYIKFNFEGDFVEMHSPWNTNVKGTLRFSTDGGTVGFCNSKKDFLEGNWLRSEKTSNGNCVAITRKIILPPKRKEKAEFVLSFGRFAGAAEAIEGMQLEESSYENKITIDTPDNELNDIFNNFLVNQIVNGRIYGRTGFYQCSGAYGFRDQLQDTLSLLITRPELAKWQILRCCSAQFREGDVLHWWYSLPGNKKLKGVRTRYSDDLLWLCYVLAKYVKTTGDKEILNKQIAFLSGDVLLENEHEKYFEAERSDEKASVLEHAKRAVKKGIRLGEHSLILIGGGDWNDGYNKVGIKGKGESVWLTQFAAMVVSEMAEVFEIIGDEKSKAEYEILANDLKKAVDECAWDGDHYIRAFYDDGSKMGAWESPECKIDSLSQSFSVLSDMPYEERKNIALSTAFSELVDKENGIIKLFSPAFSGRDKSAGYVADYPMGFRENGGQYTHAAVWLCLAFFEQNMGDKGYELIKMLNPLSKYKDERMAKKYKTEPYYLCGDVYSAKGYEGRGGWSLYTGSAGWYYIAVLEGLLGIKVIDKRLYINPRLPAKWGGFNIELQISGCLIDVTVKNNKDSFLTVDGKRADFIPLDGKNHSAFLQ